jgi:ribosome-binding protein aMBF1 (putative translation factor)
LEFRSIDEVHGARTPVTSKGVVVYADFSGTSHVEPLPAGFVDIDDLVAEHERDPARRAALEEGNKYVAERYYANAGGLAALRLRRGWSQRTLAEAAGMKQPHIARLETGKNDPSLTTMRRLAIALDVELEVLVRALDDAAKEGP